MTALRTRVLRFIWQLYPDRIRGYRFWRQLKRIAQARPRLFFIQIGANDGVVADPLRQFILKYRWRGILVEPLPAAFQALKRNYHGVEGLQFENSAIGKEAGEATLYYLKNSEQLVRWCGSIASFSKEHVLKHRWAVPGMEHLIEEVRVPTLSFPQLLEKYHVRQLDLVCIDVEGFDWEVMQQIPFDRWRPAAIMYEHVHLKDVEKAACERLLEGHGYTLARTSRDTLAVRYEANTTQP